MNRFHRYELLAAWFKEYLTIKNYLPRTIKDYTYELTRFERFLKTETDINDLDDLQADYIKAYMSWLYQHQAAPRSIHNRLAALKCFFRTLYTEQKLYIDLSNVVHMPRVGKTLPTNILTEEESKKVFDYLESRTLYEVHSLDQAIIVRDRLVLELLYATGLRKGELLNITLGDCNLSDGLLTIHKGKGNKDRVVPLGKYAVAALENYIRIARPFLAHIYTADHLLLNKMGKPLSNGGAIESAIKKALSGAGISKHIRVHDMRHTCATHMLNHGADIRYVQELLGHSCLSSTQVYTHVSIKKLQETHHKFHPRERGEV
jgi:site-specific recombinase XerD